MTNLTILTAITVTFGVVGIGYFMQWKKKHKSYLCVKDILSWIDDVASTIKPEVNCQYEVKVLPNAETKKLTKERDCFAYAAIFIKKTQEKETVIGSKVFYAIWLEEELKPLRVGNIVIIPVNL